MRAELLQLAADLARRGEPFVMAVVVRRESYSSAHQGDMAVITAGGAYHGWLGGNCTRPAVKREARRALADGQPRLVSISGEASDARPGVTVLPMNCHSGGKVDIYLEPVLPVPRLLLFGPSPVSSALSRLGKAMGYLVESVGSSAEGGESDHVYPDASAPELRALASTSEHLFSVVATMGESDEDSIAAALALEPAYLAVVASRKRFALLHETLLARGFPSAALDRIRNPAGLDIGARQPEEVALSIMAEVVKVRRELAARLAEESELTSRDASAEEEALDPVCGMTVIVKTARHRADHRDRPYYFCNARCREKFLLAPERYVGEPARVEGKG
jgi:xanthine dehydrogenase accessory factor